MSGLKSWSLLQLIDLKYRLTFLTGRWNMRKVQHWGGAINLRYIGRFKCEWVGVAKVEQNGESSDGNAGQHKVRLVLGGSEKIEEEVRVGGKNWTMGSELFSIDMERHIAEEAFDALLVQSLQNKGRVLDRQNIGALVLRPTSRRRVLELASITERCR